ncbi:murein biosynthesis integral membrane protein MurJ [Streptomyces sp. NPDC048266]|uniref:murein biosynthesis integral membrane protein MurJ n=1 Tax=Streptomyces sp. NPDC048266 TaxID=3155787 RepID=UPI0033F1F4C5
MDATAASVPVPAQSASQAAQPLVGGSAADAHEPTAKAAGSGGMLLGSLVSRITGFLRSTMVVAALGTGLAGDAFNVANTLPNIVFMLMIGGALNSVFVPELIRAAQDADGGTTFTDRLVTACVVLLLTTSTVTVVAAPWLVHLYAPTFAGHQLEATVALARYCLPQIFFYGVFAVLGQVLNARERFGAMVWAPVANNLVVIGLFGLYLSFANHVDGAGGMAPWQVALLGAGSTVGIVVQALALLPSLRKSGYRWRPRFDWRGAQLTRPLRAAGWALLLIAVAQTSFWVITVLATGVSQRAAAQGVTVGAGLTAYNNAYQLWIVPEGIVVVSLVTAALPSLTRAAQAGDYAGLTGGLARTVRHFTGVTTLAAVVFFVLGEQVAELVYGYGAVTRGDVRVLGQILAGFALGLPAFCVQYTLTRGFYALGDPRTPVLLALLTSGLNAALSAAAVRTLPMLWATAGMALAHTVACLTGAAATAIVLHRRVHRAAGLEDRQPQWLGSASALSNLGQVGIHLRVVVACLPGAAAAVPTASWARAQLGDGATGNLAALTVGCLVLALSLLLLARPLSVTEATVLLHPILHWLSRLRVCATTNRALSARRRSVHRRR